MPTVSVPSAHFSGRLAPRLPIAEKRPLRPPPFCNRQHHRRPTCFFLLTDASPGRQSAHLRGPRCLANASTSCSGRHRQPRKSAHSGRRSSPRSPIEEDRPLRSPPFFNRRLHRKPTGFHSDTFAHPGPGRDELRPLLRTGGAPQPIRHRRRRNAPQLRRIFGNDPPIRFVLVRPVGTTPGATNRRIYPLRCTGFTSRTIGIPRLPISTTRRKRSPDLASFAVPYDECHGT